MWGLRWQSLIVAAGRGRPGFEPFQVASNVAERMRLGGWSTEERSPRGVRGGLGVSRSLEAPQAPSATKESLLRLRGRAERQEACLQPLREPRGPSPGALT